ncbi:MAG: hypothetical protein ACT4P8_07605 [Betaproteobacteria bacterium]
MVAMPLNMIPPRLVVFVTLQRECVIVVQHQNAPPICVTIYSGPLTEDGLLQPKLAIGRITVLPRPQTYDKVDKT